jgi:hypothetical protein
LIEQNRIEKLAWDMPSSLLQMFVNYGQKSFITLGPGSNLSGTNTVLYSKGKFLNFPEIIGIG